MVADRVTARSVLPGPPWGRTRPDTSSGEAKNDRVSLNRVGSRVSFSTSAPTNARSRYAPVEFDAPATCTVYVPLAATGTAVVYAGLPPIVLVAVASAAPAGSRRVTTARSPASWSTPTVS